MESLAGSPYPRDDAHHSHAGSASQRLLFRALDGRPHSPKYRFGSPAADAHETDPAPESPRHRGSFSDSWDAGRGPRSPGAWSPRSEDDGCPPQSPAPHRRKSLNPVRSLAVAPADEKARAQEGIVVLDVFSKLRENPSDLLYDREQKKRELEYQMRMDVTFNPMPPPAAATHMAPGSAPNSTIHSPARTTPSTPYFYSSSAPSSPTYRRVRTMDDGYPPAIRTDADLFGVRRERSDSAPLPRYNGSLRRRQSFSNSSPHSPQRGNEDSSESVSSESSTSGSPNPTKPPSAPRKRKENHGGEIGGPPKRRGRKPNVSKLVRDFLPNHSKVLNGVDQLNSNINDFQKLRSDASETAGAPMVTWKGHPLPVDEGQEGYDLLTDEEKKICSILRLLPVQYLAIKDALLSAYEQRKTPFKKREAQKMCRVDVNKTAKVYDWFRYLNWLPQEVFGHVDEEEL